MPYMKFQLFMNNKVGTFISLNSIKINLDGTTMWDDDLVLGVPGTTSYYHNPFSFCIEPNKQGILDVYYSKIARPELIRPFTIRVGYLDSDAGPKCVYASYPP